MWSDADCAGLVASPVCQRQTDGPDTTTTVDTTTTADTTTSYESKCVLYRGSSIQM